MYPYLHLFDQQIPLYGICFFWGFAVSTVIIWFGLKRVGCNEIHAITISLIALAVGAFGASLFSFFEHHSMLDFSRYEYFFASGKNVFGGVLMAILAIMIYNKLLKLDQIKVFGALFPGFLVGYAIGRLGCFLSGDGCYGIETDSILGMSFPHGMIPAVNPVYPTPLFDFILLTGFGMILLNVLKRQGPFASVTYGLLILGGERFLIEFIRTNPVYGIFTQSQWISLGLILVGVVMLWRLKTEGNKKEALAIN